MALSLLPSQQQSVCATCVSKVQHIRVSLLWLQGRSRMPAPKSEAYCCVLPVLDLIACLQIKRVVDPEAEALRMAEMRRLQRQMKGIKLQYIAENDTVFFSDVAGIGEAKVRLILPHTVLTFFTRSHM